GLQPRPPQRALPVELEVREPVRRLDNRRAPPVRCVSEAHSVVCGTKPNLLLQRLHRTSASPRRPSPPGAGLPKSPYRVLDARDQTIGGREKAGHGDIAVEARCLQNACSRKAPVAASRASCASRAPSSVRSEDDLHRLVAL